MIEVLGDIPVISDGGWKTWGDEREAALPPVGVAVRAWRRWVGVEVGYRQSYTAWDIEDGITASTGLLRVNLAVRTPPSTRPVTAYAVAAAGLGVGYGQIEGMTPRFTAGMNLAAEGGVAGRDGWRPRLGVRVDGNVPGGEWVLWNTYAEGRRVWTWTVGNFGLRLVVGGAWG